MKRILFQVALVAALVTTAAAETLQNDHAHRAGRGRAG